MTPPHEPESGGQRQWAQGASVDLEEACEDEGVTNVRALRCIRPGVQPDETAMGAIITEALRPEIAEDIGPILQGMAEHHPHEPHWYLPLIAADPSWIGKGLGTLLMKHALTMRRGRDRGLPRKLESAKHFPL